MRYFHSWPLNKVLALVVLGGLASLFIDIRWKHRVELLRHWQSWIPLVYSGLMLVVSVVGLYQWDAWGRRLLQVGFSLGLVVGVLGVWFHSRAVPVGNLQHILTAWLLPLGTNGGIKGVMPPELAPLAFVGMGTIGLIACSKRFQYDPLPSSSTQANEPGAIRSATMSQ